MSSPMNFGPKSPTVACGWGWSHGGGGAGVAVNDRGPVLRNGPERLAEIAPVTRRDAGMARAYLFPLFMVLLPCIADRAADAIGGVGLLGSWTETHD